MTNVNQTKYSVRFEKGQEIIRLMAQLKRIPDPVLVFGYDELDGHRFLIYGKDTLERCIETNTNITCDVLTIDILQATDELEMLIACVLEAKGREDYSAFTVSALSAQDRATQADVIVWEGTVYTIKSPVKK